MDKKKVGRPKTETPRGKIVGVRLTEQEEKQLDELGQKLDSPNRSKTIIEALKALKKALQFNSKEIELIINYKTVNI